MLLGTESLKQILSITIITAIKDMKVSQRKIAAIIGVSRSSISDICGGRLNHVSVEKMTYIITKMASVMEWYRPDDTV